MKIGIIGVGMIGGALTRALTKLGHTVKIANSRTPDTLSPLSTETGAIACTIQDVVKDVELVILSIPQKAVPSLPKQLFHTIPDYVPIIDTGNYYPAWRDDRIEELEAGMVESVWVQQHLDHSVVKVFNNIMSHSLVGEANRSLHRIALPVAGDIPAHKQMVSTLLDELGFDSVDAGKLSDSWRQEPGTPVYCTDYDAAGVRKALAQADKSKSHAFREYGFKKLMESLSSNGAASPSAAELVEANRQMSPSKQFIDRLIQTCRDVYVTYPNLPQA